ncbi:HNH endonuclease [Pectobacterium phage vB_PatM_CB7]|nr:HNH endonuclease [Pectobacterium phage vB_PatM_CB7]
MAIKHNGVNCYVCGQAITKESFATLEHIIPVSKGGTDNMDNLALSHQKCNQLRGNNETD